MTRDLFAIFRNPTGSRRDRRTPPPRPNPAVEELEQRLVLSPITQTLSVDPVNPRYFADGSGHAIYLTGDHTWNDVQSRTDQAPTNYSTYLSFLQSSNFNFTRLWTWEQADWAPWTTDKVVFSPTIYARSGTPGALDGGNKFDLNQFNPAYFNLLANNVEQARQAGIYVSVQLFQGWSVGTKPGEPGNPWLGHPFDGANNINGVNGDMNGDGIGSEIETQQFWGTPMGDRVWAYQKAYIDKVVDTVGNEANVIYEIGNEMNGDSIGFQNAVIAEIHSREQQDGFARHLTWMTSPWPNGDNNALFSSSADVVAPNGYYDPAPATGNKVVISDTDHIYGMGGDQTWVWDNFTRGMNTAYMDDMAGTPLNGGAPRWQVSARQAMGETLYWADRIDLEHMLPYDTNVASSGHVLANLTGGEYLAFDPAGASLTLNNLAGGTYAVEWMDVNNNTIGPVSTWTTGGGNVSFNSPYGGDDAVLHLKLTNPSGQTQSDPIGEWKFDEGSGGSTADASGNGNTATLHGATWTTGQSGAALSFNGTNAYVTAPSTAALNSLKGQMTVSVWVNKAADLPNYGGIVGRRQGTGYGDLWNLYYNNSGGDEYSFSVSTTGGSANVTGPASTGDLNQWVLLAGVYDGSQVRLYVNGVQVGSAAASGLIPDETSPLTIGAGDNGSYGISEFYHGKLDDVRVYNRALSGSEIAAMMQSGPPANPTGLNATGGNGQVFLSWNTVSGASSYNLYRGTSSGGETLLASGVTGTSYTDSGLSNGTTYYYQVAAVNNVGPGGLSNQVSATPQAPASLPSPWQDGDIGSPGKAGSATYSNGTFTVNGGGSDIWNSSDQFNYVHQAVSGNQTIIARVASQQNTDPWAKAGVMVRDSLNANGAYAFVHTTPGNGTDFQFRTGDGASAQWTGQVSAVAPEWVKLVINGTTITGFVSSDGTTWTQIGSTTLPLGSTYYVGLADTAHNNGLLSTDTFTNVSVTSQSTAVVGTGTGLTGQYYSDTNLQNLVLTRTDPTVNFTWPNDTAPVSGLPADNWSVKWTGQVQAQYSEAYTFSTVSDDGVRLYVNGQLVINDWTYHAATTDNSAAIQLVAGQKYTIEMDFFEGGGAATAQLYWSSPSTPRQMTPMSQLYSAGASQAVNLSGSFNRVGIATDGATFSGGLDGGGSALSATLLGSGVSWNGQQFNLGGANTNNVISAQGQTISLPQGNYSSLMLLADAVNGNQANLTFTVNYTDETSQTITQSFSDWYTPQSYAGESVAVSTGYRNLSNGAKQNGPFNVYGYKFSLNSGKTVKSITLPNDANLEILAMNLAP